MQPVLSELRKCHLNQRNWVSMVAQLVDISLGQGTRPPTAGGI